MLNADEATDVVRDLWELRRNEIVKHDRVNGYLRGRLGVPDVPEGAGAELKDLARDSVKNVCSIVVDAFSQCLSVNGFRSPDTEGDDPAWAWWQAQRLDARQAEAIRPAVAYGSSYAVLDPAGNVRLRTPRQMLAVYADPLADLWPTYALEVWTDYSGRVPVRRGRLYDDEAEYLLDLGDRHHDVSSADEQNNYTTQRVTVRDLLDVTPHSAAVTPVVRFVNRRDAEEVVTGEVEPLIRAQRALNAVNFDRLVVARFGAFPQRYAIGWAAESPQQLARVAMDRLLAFEDETVKVGAFPAADVSGHNSIISEMLTHIAMQANIPLSAFGSMANLSAEALAMAEAPYQRKLAEKRESFGESWEQLIRLAAMMRGVQVADDAEVSWRETETRSFAQVVDGIVKLSTAGVPIEELIREIPGWSKTRADEAVAAIRRANGRGVLEMIAGRDQGAGAQDIRSQAEALGVLIRAGADPESAAAAVGLTGINFTGAVPVSLRLPETQALALEANGNAGPA